MEEIHLPDTLKKLDMNAFYRCYSLKNVHIPSGVCTIKGNPFFRCSSLTAITVTNKNEYFSSIDGVLYTKDHSCLLVYPEGKKSVAYTVPDSVKEIGLDAFGYHPLFKYIAIHEGVTTFPSNNLFIFPEEVVLCVQTGSSAEKYAKRYELQYENFP